MLELKFMFYWWEFVITGCAIAGTKIAFGAFTPDVAYSFLHYNSTAITLVVHFAGPFV